MGNLGSIGFTDKDEELNGLGRISIATGRTLDQYSRKIEQASGLRVSRPTIAPPPSTGGPSRRPAAAPKMVMTVAQHNSSAQTRRSQPNTSALPTFIQAKAIPGSARSAATHTVRIPAPVPVKKAPPVKAPPAPSAPVPASAGGGSPSGSVPVATGGTTAGVSNKVLLITGAGLVGSLLIAALLRRDGTRYVVQEKQP